MYVVMFYTVLPTYAGFIWFKLGLTHCAGENQFNRGKMPTLYSASHIRYNPADALRSQKTVK